MEDNLIVIRALIIKFPLLTPGFLSQTLFKDMRHPLTTKLIIQVLMVLTNHFR